jgi:hypothetical protein
LERVGSHGDGRRRPGALCRSAVWFTRHCHRRGTRQRCFHIAHPTSVRRSNHQADTEVSRRAPARTGLLSSLTSTRSLGQEGKRDGSRQHLLHAFGIRKGHADAFALEKPGCGALVAHRPAIGMAPGSGPPRRRATGNTRPGGRGTAHARHGVPFGARRSLPSYRSAFVRKNKSARAHHGVLTRGASNARSAPCDAYRRGDVGVRLSSPARSNDAPQRRIVRTRTDRCVTSGGLLR